MVLRFGSSPRLWGTPDFSGYKRRVIRFIPTPVGNTHSLLFAILASSVHPHACGEHASKFSVLHNLQRFIPTPVGNTKFLCVFPPLCAVHPHACGEHKQSFVKTFLQLGSSPRLWGTPDFSSLSCHHMRFIPTPVGNTFQGRAPGDPLTVHPHACGEHAHSPNLFDLAYHGSSPRLWGTLTVGFRVISRPRFIPTPVGNTSGRAGSRVEIQVHPHACGEHNDPEKWPVMKHGSSPRLWGTQHLVIFPFVIFRFIPTPVGNTRTNL